MCEKLKRELISSNSKVTFFSVNLYIKNMILKCIIAYWLFYTLLQLQKATKETNRIKEDMKALQNDLSNADKEITVRKITLLLYKIYTNTLIAYIDCFSSLECFKVKSYIICMQMKHKGKMNWEILLFWKKHLWVSKSCVWFEYKLFLTDPYGCVSNIWCFAEPEEESGNSSADVKHSYSH